jgi:hypothetical protein
VRRFSQPAIRSQLSTPQEGGMFDKLKRMSFLFAPFLALSLCSFAAQYETKPQKETKGKTVSVTGCLQKGDKEGEFSITSSEGRKYGLQSTGVNLAEHVGHTVTVTGTKATEQRREKKKAETTKGEAKAEHANLQVTDLKMVSETCK